MAARISRRILAAHVADRLVSHDEHIVTRLAAFLVETRRTAELPLLVRDIETALLTRGIVIADVTSARDLTSTTERAITRLLTDTYGGDVQLRQRLDPSLISGVLVQTADAQVDATTRRALSRLRTIKTKEGAS